MVSGYRFLYWLVPTLVFVLVLVLTLVDNASQGFSWFFGWWRWVLFPGIAFLVSGIVFLFSNVLGRKGDGGVREYNSRGFLLERVRDELRRSHFLEVETFGELSDSLGYVGNYGSDSQTRVFHGVLRSVSSLPRWVLFAVNMEKGKEDLLSFRFAPMNFGFDELERLRMGMVNELADSPEKQHGVFEVSRFDPSTGGSVTERRIIEGERKKEDDEE